VSSFWRVLREYGPHFNGFTVLETGVAFGYLNGICKAVCLNKPVTCDRLLGFRKRVAVMRGTVVVDGDAFGKIEAIVECG
jgi:hypothetical protein